MNSNSNKTYKNITFSYSENFNRVVELSIENYPSWRTNILYLLTINNLESYITKEKVKKLRKRDIKDDIDDYLEDQFDNNLVYDTETNLLDIKNDVLVKWIILNTLGERTKRIVEGQGKTAYEIWQILNRSFTRSTERRKLEIKNKINNLKYNEDEDINIFIATLQNAIDEYELIDHDISDANKAGILNRSLPENLRWINVFQYKNDWKKLCEYVKNVIPDIIFSNLRETTLIKDNENKIFNVEIKEPQKSTNLTTRIPKGKRRPGKCFTCGKFGHYSKDCRYNKFNTSFRTIKHRKHNLKSKVHQKRRHFHQNHKSRSSKQLAAVSLTDRNENKVTFNDNDTATATILIITKLNPSKAKYNQNLHLKKSVSNWIIDSGASVNITSSPELLHNTQKCEEPISTANGELMKATIIGTFTGYINNTKFVLNNVYYVPGIKKNIISISQLINQNYKVIFHNNKNTPSVIIYDKNGNRISSLTTNSQHIFTIYISSKPIDFQNECENTTNTNYTCNIINSDKYKLWHRRLAHFGFNTIKNKLFKLNIKQNCEICSQSKLKNKPFKRSTNNSHSCFNLIYMDLLSFCLVYVITWLECTII